MTQLASIDIMNCVAVAGRTSCSRTKASNTALLRASSSVKTCAQQLASSMFVDSIRQLCFEACSTWRLHTARKRPVAGQVRKHASGPAVPDSLQWSSNRRADLATSTGAGEVAMPAHLALPVHGDAHALLLVPDAAAVIFDPPVHLQPHDQ